MNKKATTSTLPINNSSNNNVDDNLNNNASRNINSSNNNTNQNTNNNNSQINVIQNKQINIPNVPSAPKISIIPSVPKIPAIPKVPQAKIPSFVESSKLDNKALEKRGSLLDQIRTENPMTRLKKLNPEDKKPETVLTKKKEVRSMTANPVR